MKKKILGVLIAIMALSLSLALAGCFGGSSDNNNGSNNEPIITYTSISTASELQSISNQSGNYKLVNSIDISGNSWTPIEGFTGLLEGDNYEIQGLTISGNKENAGLFSTLKGTVQNLKVTSVNITGTGDAGTAGAVCGTNEGTIKNVTVSGTINTPYYSNVGGVAGKGTSGNISNCTNSITITAYECVGGISGYLVLANGKSCDGNTNNGAISGKNNVGGIVGQIQGGAPSNYETGSSTFTNNINNEIIVGSNNNIGGLIGYQSSAKASYGSNSYTYLTISSSQNKAVVNGKDCVGGIIGYADKLSEITSSINTADITGANYVGGYVGKSAGTGIKIASNNNTITGKGYVGGIAGYCGNLTDCTNSGSIISTALIVEDSASRAYVGGVAGYATLINNCTNNANISVTTGGDFVGGIVGYLKTASSGTCDGNVNNGEVSGKNCVGGIVGKVQGGAPSNYETGSLSFTNNENTKTISGSGDQVGGLIGYQSSDKASYGSDSYTYITVSSCINSNTVNGKDYVGGILGCGDKLSEITSSSNTADITGANYVGGYVGKGIGASIKIATNNNAITGKGYVGGIAGYCGKVNDCTNNGSVISTAAIIENSASKAYVGGIAGYATLINSCTNNSDISVTTGGDYVGGIVGYLYLSNGSSCDGNINNGELSGSNYVGGIVGYIQSGAPSNYETGSTNLTNCENSKDVTGSNYVGGIVGHQTSNKASYGSNSYTYMTISNCINWGDISGGNYVGGIIAYGNYCVTTEAVWATNTNNGLITGSNKGQLYGYLK